MARLVGRRPARKRLTQRALASRNLRAVRRHHILSAEQTNALQQLTEEFQLSVVLGDLKLLEGNWYVSHSGLLRVARRNRCCGIRSDVDKSLSDPASSRWVFKATVYKNPRSRGHFPNAGDPKRSPLRRQGFSLNHAANLACA